MTYLVTGASSGIGRATALRLAERGNRVWAGVRRIEDAPAHSLIRPIMLDVTKPDQLAAAAPEIEELHGLVNNAGVTYAGPIEHLPVDRLRAQLEVNVVGLVAVTQTFLPAIRAGRGRIVMISSTAGRVVTPMLGAYSASKHAVEAVADALRQELRPWSVPVVIIEPGSFKSRNRPGAEQLAAADRLNMSESAESRYGGAMDAFLRFSRKVEAEAGDAAQVASVVERALTTGCPRPRYVVGTESRAVIALQKLLPTRVMDALMCRATGIHKPSSARA